MKRFVATCLLALSAAAVHAQSPADFPADATVPSADALRAAFADRTWTAKLADGNGWKLQFKGNGHYFIDTTSGFHDNGQWKTEDGRLCTVPRKTKASCNEVRGQEAGSLLLRRESGEIVRLVAN